MNHLLFSAVAVLLGYLIGSLSFAVIVTRTMGLSDPRTYGSKNPGATNVLRSGSKTAAIVTLLLDALKAALPMLAVRCWGQPYGMGEGTVALVGLAAFIGHLYPVFFRFVGGKGVATALGVLLAGNWLLGLATVATFAIVLYFSRYVSLASMVAAVFAPVYFLFGAGSAWDMDGTTVLALAVMSALLIWRHAENINRLLKGTESRLGQKKH